MYIHIYLHMSTIFYTYIHIYIFRYIYLFFSHDIMVDRPSRSQCVLSWLPHAAHTTISWITFCNTIVRFNQSNNSNQFENFR